MTDGANRDWKSKSLRVAGGLAARKPTAFEGTRPYVATRDIAKGRIAPGQEVTFLGRPARADLELREGDVVQAKMRDTDKAFLVTKDEDGWLASTGFAQFRSDAAEAASEFIYHYLRSDTFLRERDRLSVGTTQQAISDSELASMEVLVPPPEEQERIAGVLNALELTVRRTEDEIDKLLAVRRGLLESLAAGGPATGPQEDSPVGPLPPEWELVRLSTMTRMITSGSRGWARYYAAAGSKFLRIANLTREHINLRFDSLVHVLPPGGAEGNRTAVQESDILVSITADLGIVGVAPPGLGDAFVNQHIALVRLNEDSDVSARWVGHYLSSLRGQRQFSRLDDPGAKSGMNLTTVGDLWIAVPPRAYREEAVSALDEIDERIARERKLARKLQDVGRGLSAALIEPGAREGR